MVGEVFLNVASLSSSSAAPRRTLAQQTGWQRGSGETPAAQTAAGQMPALALGHWPDGEISPMEAD